MHQADDSTIFQSTTLTDYFHHALREAARERAVDAEDATLHYLTLLLGTYARSDRVFDYDDQRWQLRPLALLYAEALNARNECERRLWLQRLGDLALFVGGLFSGQLSRRFRDLDYCIAMGGNAYSYLHQASQETRQLGLAEVYEELAARFDLFVGLVAAVARPERVSRALVTVD
jgi:hypothetical protein